MIGFAAPEWLLLLPALAFAAWWWPALPLRRAGRVLVLVLLVLALARPYRTSGGGVDLWVLVDRSASAADRVESRRAELERLKK